MLRVVRLLIWEGTISAAMIHHRNVHLLHCRQVATLYQTVHHLVNTSAMYIMNVVMSTATRAVTGAVRISIVVMDILCKGSKSQAHYRSPQQ